MKSETEEKGVNENSTMNVPRTTYLSELCADNFIEARKKRNCIP